MTNILKCGLSKLLIIMLFEACSNFNFDTNFIDIIQIGGDDNTYFGYSVLLQKGRTSSVLVGAPRSNSTHKNYTDIKEPGVLYKCDIGNNEPCKPFLIDPEGNIENKPGDSRFNYKSRKDGAMLAATIDGGENVGDPIVVCSPNWVNDRFDRNGEHYLINGMCYLLQDSGKVDAIGNKIMPLLNAGKQGYSLDVVKYYYAMGQAGSSIHYMNKGQSWELLLGAPGVLSWKGTVIRYKSSNVNNNPPQQRFTQFRAKRQVYDDANIPNPVFFANKEDNTYLGYSVASGRFYSIYPDILWYAAGAPRAAVLYGTVLLYEYAMNDDADLIIHETFVGSQFGSYFGASLLCIDINGDLADDVLVGAPTFTTDSWDEGCVYIYKNTGEAAFNVPVNICGDKKPGARFGTAISNLGDINGDSYKDVAIAAPNEDGHGTIYVYLGSKNGLNTEYSQKVSASNIDLSLRGFGFSMSKGVDVDQNLSNDIAVGAYKSGHVAILKSRPVIKYIAKLDSNLQELPVDINTFNVSYCIRFDCSNDLVENVDVNIQINTDSRAVNKNKLDRMLTLTKNNSNCGNTTIMIRKSESMDYSIPFSVEFLYTLVNKPQQDFCSKCPFVDPSDSKSVVLEIPFANGCGSDNICQPDLKIMAAFENNLDSLTIGTTATLKLHVHIENSGEPAYLSTVMMILPQDIEILRISSKCNFGDERLYQCTLDVLQTNAKKELIFEFDIRNLNPKESELTLNITVDSRGEDINLEDNTFIVSLLLQSISDINIAGKSVPEQIVYVNDENKMKFNLINFTHEFFIQNFGPSPLLDYTIHFYLPTEADSSRASILFDIHKPEVYVNNQLMNCTAEHEMDFFNDDTPGKDIDIDNALGPATRRLKRSSVSTSNDVLNSLPMDRVLFINCSMSNIKCLQVTCISETVLGRNQHITASFSLRGHVDVLNQMLGTKDIIVVSSNAEIITNTGKTVSFSVHTLLLGALIETTVSYWIYIVCVLSAFIILTIIVAVLYKLNFFNRPVREKLQNEYENSSTVREINDDDHLDDYESDEHVDSRL